MKKKVCPICKSVELTEQEHKHPLGRCYWCVKEYHEKAARTLGQAMAPPNPSDFGRTEAEVALGRPKPADPSDPTASYRRPTGGIDPVAESVPFSAESREILKQNFLYDPENPPVVTEVIARGNYGTQLELRMPVGIAKEWQDVIQGQLEEMLKHVIRLLTFGTLHDSIKEGMTQGGQPFGQHGRE